VKIRTFYVFLNLCNQMDHCSFGAGHGKPRRNVCSRPPQYVHSCLLLLPHYLANVVFTILDINI